MGQPQPSDLRFRDETFDLRAFPEISQLSRQTGVVRHKRVKITQIRQEKIAPRLLLLVRKHAVSDVSLILF